jgi:hypothetical protein
MSIDCERVARLFEPDAEDRPTAARLAEAREHAEACERCARDFGPDLALAERLAVVPETAAPRWRPKRRPLVFVAAAALAAGVIAFVALSHSPAPPTSVAPALRFELPPDTRFTLRTGVVRLEPDGPVAVYESHVYRPPTSNRP